MRILYKLGRDGGSLHPQGQAMGCFSVGEIGSAETLENCKCGSDMVSWTTKAGSCPVYSLLLLQGIEVFGFQACLLLEWGSATLPSTVGIQLVSAQYGLAIICLQILKEAFQIFCIPKRFSSGCVQETNFITFWRDIVDVAFNGIIFCGEMDDVTYGKWCSDSWSAAW